MTHLNKMIKLIYNKNKYKMRNLQKIYCFHNKLYKMLKMNIKLKRNKINI